MNNFKELEFKFKADDVKLQDFLKHLESYNPDKAKDVSSWDFYYTSAANQDEFMRYRDSDDPELTIKRKVNTNNNWERIEVDLPLDKKRISKSVADTWAGLLGYQNNFNIYKTCFIRWIGNINAVYYIVYNENMKEVGRYIEVEVNKEAVPVLGVDKAFEELKGFEQSLAVLGLSPQNRLKRSLFEIHRKV